MNEPYPGGPSHGYQSHPGGRQPDRRQPDRRPDDDWRRPQRGQERWPQPGEVSGEPGQGGQQRHGRRRRPELDQTTVDQITVVDGAVAGQTEFLDLQEHRAGWSWRSINWNWSVISRNWAVISRNPVLMAGLVLFLIDTFLMADGFASPVATTSRVMVVFIWLVSLAAFALLWLRGSSKFSLQNPFVRVETEAQQR